MNIYKRHRFPPEVISYTVWLYQRFNLSHRHIAHQSARVALCGRSPDFSTWVWLGVGFFASPGAYHAVTFLDFPVSMNGYRFSQNPDEPIIVHMECFPKGDNPNLTPREQRLAGRRELYATSFETIESETRRQLAGALGSVGIRVTL